MTRAHDVIDDAAVQSNAWAIARGLKRVAVLGISSVEATQRLTSAGIDAVQDRCVMVDHRRATRV